MVCSKGGRTSAAMIGVVRLEWPNYAFRDVCSIKGYPPAQITAGILAAAVATRPTC